ncbi:nucleotidyltransferase family protein [Rhizobium sp. TAL182]|uniref:nucleotidyltransferase family protein n=1 Tax=Rhizobium sp. TAL182 TaxID=2020313 RepID=UPI0032AEF4CA
MPKPQMELQAIISQSPLLSTVLGHWDEIGLPDGRLVAGAIAQTVWNHAFDFAHDHGINDIDLSISTTMTCPKARKQTTRSVSGAYSPICLSGSM